MKHLIYMFIFFPMFMFGQSSGNNNSQKESVSVDKESSKKRVFFSSIKDNLNAKVVVAYGNKSSEVITDFYNYLTFYNQSETADLQKELDKSIQQMFVSETTLIEDFINGTNKKITLLQFLQYCKENKFVVSVSNLQNTAVESNHFVMKYQLLVTNKSVTKTYNLSQKVYLYPVVKTFGNTEKVVWEIKLGEF
jgi:hypothetical protein